MPIQENSWWISAPRGPLCVSPKALRAGMPRGEMSPGEMEQEEFGEGGDVSEAGGQGRQRDRAQTLARPKLSLIVPTYNEAQNVTRVVELLTGILERALGDRYELMIVDDDSPDGTWQIAGALTEDYPHLRVMRRQSERGLSTAVIRGWQAAEGEVLGVIDGDLQHPPETLFRLLESIDQGADLAVASRHVEGGGVSRWSLARRILSRGAQILGLVLLPRVLNRVSDPMSGYFMVRRSAIADALLSPVGYKILLEVIGRGRVDRIAEVGYVFQERTEGESKVTWRQYGDYLLHLMRLRVTTGRLRHLQQPLSQTIKTFPMARFLRFAMVGASGLVVDMGLLYLLHGVLEFGLTRSSIFAAELAILNNFVWNDLWTFRDVSQQQRQSRAIAKRLLKFNGVCLMGLILKILILNALFNGLHLDPYLANFSAILTVTFWNFWINLKLNWRVTQI
jgi:dolichol-phosphate mannosyltransferase